VLYVHHVSEEYVAAVRRSLDGWNRGDFDECISIAHPEIEWVSDLSQRLSGSQTVYRGLEGMRRYWDEWHSIWTVTLDVKEIVDLGDTVLALATTHARGGASGATLQQPVAYVFEFEDRMARWVRSYMEPDRALDAVGLTSWPG
jgi:ketosteroid isomerase-like protein